ncbi:4'-phosphopantetheinyl transferase [Yoonia maritima]|uniref:4'-phosphopantetheinyl transferase n=1 Tax=Yoonia maritima TaxID=1435347 RepID=A0A2T0VXB5_9RHOB|nr:4'-phosphopantetheinyl transferase superfamily protein [Yoonia maritima]PRY76677.1 4'-phosphopantetheinyl transferase [Yoonia maritima]
MTLSPCTVHVWHVNLDSDASPELTVLSATEMNVAQDIQCVEARELYLLTHVRLRQILGNWMQFDPSDVAFDTGWNGKPRIKGAAGPSFSISHSGRRAVIAVTHTAPVGIDIELQRDRKLDRKTGQRFFAPDEAAALKPLSDQEHHHTFTRLWTFKEAFIKATGEGLARKLNSFEVDISQPSDVRCTSHPGWNLREIEMPLGYYAAIAVNTHRPVTIATYNATTVLDRSVAA